MSDGVSLLDGWTGEDVTLAEVERELARLRAASVGPDGQPNLRTSVMTHLVWCPEEWFGRARSTLAAMAERHPSRTVFLIPEPDAERSGIDAAVSLACYTLPELEREICSEVVELRLRGARAKAPASVAEPLLISDLPVFCRCRGEPPWGSVELDQVVGVVDRLIVDSTEWDDLPFAYTKLPALFERAAVSDIAWARTQRWRALLASLWPEIAGVRTMRVRATAAQAYLLTGWLRSRLGVDVALEHVPDERLIGVDLDGQPAPFPPGDPPLPEDVLSEELDRLDRDPVYEEAVRAAGAIAT